ncbi:MAG: (4Fe-4S)-binding protein [Deltaproteobacteria bacterium]|nr:(4Fe-4S)-binding protein [Deltaproteobacteria bacterium]
MSTISVEVVYRGIFQKTLAHRITRGIVLAARKEGKTGIAFGRYGDSPQRNGIPAKDYAVIADNDEDLQISMSRYEPTEVEVTICLDDTLCKGVESWAWYGVQPINKLLKKEGVLIVTSSQAPDTLLKDIHQKGVEYNLAIVPGSASFSGLWVYKDDHTDVRILGAMVSTVPGSFSMRALEQAILEEWGDKLKVISAKKSGERVLVRRIPPTEGNTAPIREFTLPKYWEMQEGLVVSGLPKGETYDGEKGYRSGRSEVFKKYTTRTMRPVINFSTCTKCTLCWLQCPDSCFDVTPDGYYEANMEACCGCGVCEAVCPVDKCITMVNEEAFEDNGTQWTAWKQDKEGYLKWLDEKITHVPKRSHGFHHVGQYQEEMAEMTDLHGTAELTNDPEPSPGA